MTFDPKPLRKWLLDTLGMKTGQALSFEARINGAIVHKYLKGTRPDFGLHRFLLAKGCPPELLPPLPETGKRGAMACTNCPHNPANADVLQAMADVKPAKTAKPKLAPKAA